MEKAIKERLELKTGKPEKKGDRKKKKNSKEATKAIKNSRVN